MAKKTKIRSKILSIAIITSVVPILIVTSITLYWSFKYLEERTLNFYSNLLGQVSLNLDSVYDQYLDTLKNMVKRPEVESGLLSGPFKDTTDERNVTGQIIGFEGQDTGINKTVSERIEGYAMIYQMNRPSLVDKTEYKRYISFEDQTFPNIDKFINDPLFQELKNDSSMEMVMGKLQPGVIMGIKSRVEVPTFIFPYYNPSDKKKSELNTFLILHTYPSFLPGFYEGIDRLHFGTLYFLDHNDMMIHKNHPSDEDYYYYDDDELQYILEEDDDPNDPYATMSFSEYTLLNTDPEILQEDSVKNLISLLNTESLQKYEKDNKLSLFQASNIINYKNENYLAMVQFAPHSKMKFIYFHPQRQIYRPLFTIIIFVAAFTLIAIIAIILISILFSKSFTTPIHTLVGATKKISDGNYSEMLKVDTGDELKDLADHFNTMVRDMKAYQDKLLSSEREKTEMELATNIQTSLLPPFPESEYYEVVAKMIPAEEVGGDYFDLFTGSTSDRLWIGIGDVSGHGLASGLIMMMAQTAFNTLLLNKPDINSDELIKRVNKVMYQNIKERLGEDHFMTLSFMVAEKDGTINYSGAHEDILIYRAATGRVERLETTGVWIGLMPDITQNTPEKSLKLESGDLMFLYTDGLIEASNKASLQYDVPRLIERLEQWGNLPLEELQNNIIEDVFDYLDEQKDDITLVITRKK